MKRLIVVLMCMLLLAAGCSETPETVEMDVESGAARILPDNTALYFKAKSLDMIYKNFSIDETSAFGFEIKEVEKAKEDLGFNPLSIEELKSQGVDVAGEIGVALTSLEMNLDPEQPPAADFFFFIPVTDGGKVIERIKEITRKNSPESEIVENEGVTSISSQKEKDLSMALREKDGFVLVAFSHKKNAADLLKSFSEKPLSDMQSYKDVAGKIDSTRSLFLYANMKEILDKNKEAIANFLKSHEEKKEEIGNPFSNIVELASGYTSMGISWDFEGPDLIMNDVRNFKKESDIAKLYSDVNINKDAILGFKDNPVLLISGGANWFEYYNQMIKTSNEQDAEAIKAQLKAMKESTGIDIVADFIENLDGSVNLGIFDGASVTMMNYNAVLSFNIKDEKKALDLIENALNLMPPEKKGMIQKQNIGNVDTYVINAGFLQAYAGIKDKDLTIAVGKPTYEKALSRDVSGGFTSKMEDAQLKDALGGDGNYFYMDFPELLKIYQNFAPLMEGQPGAPTKEQMEMFKKFNYFLLANTLNETSDSNLYLFKTKFTQPFFISLKDIVQSFQPKS